MDALSNPSMNSMGGLFALMDSQVMAPGIPAGKGGDAGASGVFGNLLDLVADMQVADSQGPLQGEYLQSRTKELFDPHAQNLELAASQIGLAETMLGRNPQNAMTKPNAEVGQLLATPPAKTPSVGTASVNDLLLQGEGLSSLSRANLLEVNQAHDANRGESARMWAAAFAMNDIQSVSLEKVPEIPVDKQFSQDILAKPGLSSSPAPLPNFETINPNPSAVTTSNVAGAKPSLSAGVKVETPQLNTPKAGSPIATAPATPVVTEALSGATSDKVSRAPEAKPAPEMKATLDLSAKAPVAAAPEAKTSVQTVGAKTANSGQSGAGFEAFKAPVAERRETTEKPKGAVSGSEFLLNRSLADATASAKPAEPIVGAAVIGKPGDQRVSAESLDFVADKIDNLRTQGGGRLKVELNPNGMGSVEIRVTQQRGGMKVELLAEKPETLKALNDAKADLSTRLQTIAPSKLDVSELHVRAATPPREMTASSDLMNLRGSERANLSSVATGEIHRSESSGGASFSNSSDRGGAEAGFGKPSDPSQRESFQQGQQREERRQKAMMDWETFWEGRKSA
ncbi:MAG: flagellar hook-length control protein FliK [Bdellovibrionales bacterium]|nr:flagellar hook-length control protein FliK [Bdellovibrionales bacterium]